MCRSQRCPATVVEPTSKATPSATSWNPGKTAVISVSSRTATVAVQSPARSVFCRSGNTIGSTSRPTSDQSRSSASNNRCRSPGGVFERGLLDLDVVQPHDRIDLDRVGVGLLPHDLAMDLGLGRHVDQQIAADLRVTPEPAILGEAVAFAVALLRLGERDQVVGRARDPVLRERPRHRHHLAATADPASATDRVEVDAQGAGGVEHARTVGHLAAPPRGGEDDGVHDSACVPSRAERPPRRRPVASVPARSE